MSSFSDFYRESEAALSRNPHDPPGAADGEQDGIPLYKRRRPSLFEDVEHPDEMEGREE